MLSQPHRDLDLFALVEDFGSTLRKEDFSSLTSTQMDNERSVTKHPACTYSYPSTRRQVTSPARFSPSVIKPCQPQIPR